MKMKNPVERTCKTKCTSNCCYFPRPGLSVGIDEINSLAEAVRNEIQSFEPEYREFLHRNVEDGSFFVKKPLWGTYLRCDDSKKGFDSCMQPYYPCIFLTNAENFLSKKKLCMIHSHKFEKCKNTSEDYCMSGHKRK